MRTVIVTFLVTALASVPLGAQQPSFSILRAATAEAARQVSAPAPARPSMSPAMKWTGIGLIIGGGAMLLSGVLVDNACIDNGEHDLNFCQDVQTMWFATGAAAAGAGGVVLLLGNASKPAAPSTGFATRGLSWRIRF